MIRNHWQSDNAKCRLYMTIKTSGSKRICIVAQDFGKPNSKYANRVVNVQNERVIFLSFPVSPKQIEIIVYNVNNPDDKDISITYEKRDLVTGNAWMDYDSVDFSQLAILCSQTLGFTKAPAWYTSYDKKFRIKLMPSITDYMSGKQLSTPARIGHESGIIEANQNRMLSYTIPARMAIFLHEFSHKYRNPKIGLPINDENGADINALYIYLGLGFSKVDAIYVYCNVFLKAQSEGNKERIRAIMKYIEDFEKGNLESPRKVLIQ